MPDRRERNHQWYSRFDEERMRIVVEDFETEDGECVDLEIPVKYEVCETCDGRGKHVNPGIDSHGLSREDFDEDPDFAESYFRGDYDVPCNECHGRRVAPVPDEQACGPTLWATVQEIIDDHWAYVAEVAAERRMGA